jgi:hypothetical protein
MFSFRQGSSVLVEQRIENPRVGGANPSPATELKISSEWVSFPPLVFGYVILDHA